MNTARAALAFGLVVVAGVSAQDDGIVREEKVYKSFQYRLSINPDETVPHPDVTVVPFARVRPPRSRLRHWTRGAAAWGAVRV